MRKNLFGGTLDSEGKPVGCQACPRNSKPGINKIKGLERIQGKQLFIWAMCPGREENLKRLELVGPSGKLLWGALKLYGISRADADVQNVMRCMPSDNAPTKDELRCCAVYTEEALELGANRAAVHLILGDVAGTQLLGKNFKKDQPVFWHQPWNAYIVLNRHPSYVLRQGGVESGQVYQDWSKRFRAVKAVLNNPGQWGHVRAMNHDLVQTEAEMDALEKKLREEAAAGRRISEDLEWGTVDGKQAVLVAGFGWGRYLGKSWDSWSGGARSVVLDHPQGQASSNLKRRVVRIMEDASIMKTMHNGRSDVGISRDLLGAKLGVDLRGYDFDTYLGAYLKDSWRPAFGLEAMVNEFLPEFGDYKDSVAEWDGNFAEAPLENLMLRNCGDCSATKMLETMIAPDIPPELMRVYIHCAFTLAAMEGRGPILDKQAHENIKSVVPVLMEKIKTKLCQVAEDSDFNPNAAKQVAWLLYDKLGLPAPETNEHGNRTTGADYLESLAASTHSPVPKMILNYRELETMESNFLNTYARSADMHGGELRTKWWLTGAVTGRLRSGASGSGESGLVNLQNIHNSKLLRNMLVSDKNWRRALEL